MTPIKYYRLAMVIVNNTPSGQSYQFVTQNAINIAEVDEADVDHILALRKGCCGRRRRGAFTLATEEEYAKWKG